ncbi:MULTISPECIES: methylenetetrahydrofolate reductase C-terminal domain-containing protein [Carboxydocella]|uniref:Methylene-tetrahydrofolate reductase C terminal n=2 Tax=Carboxydocella TaxID=178898 RepID=A0A1T4QRR9_9FIRM|nr:MULTISPECIES: methylenetetrahydrofolate reductase C-terminal domain-containing protein [Carboxydocella]AVX20833.1 Methylene-tetrahydrofolate reductase subunit MetV [Carboxydocella thermautotrophica]AVX31252.1 Methylene-tetrahydrofolate reductase subunit MetV [Carboxydocella thermautotrophica]SKA06430.1 Methylene-tetrahydrofolate reductase C terminal [Carboxydocella sporoproducens DSM 16521]GAW29997.1 Uncharacterized protein XD63_0072 [Carboxydocella sp. ULO1]GAW30400.1 Uncharacterized prote
MIVADRKPLEEILQSVSNYKKILLLGCRGCVTVCLAGGEKEVGILAEQLRLARQENGQPLEVLEATVERQCDYEFIDQVREMVPEVEAILSTACGVGVQGVAERFPAVRVHPALNTKFMGINLKVGEWAERCLGCGNCVLSITGGVCPIARCSKNLLNGPCGGSQNGKCEISKDIDCGWQLIHDRLQRLGLVERLLEIQPPKDWTTARDGGPRKLVREELYLESGE